MTAIRIKFKGQKAVRPDDPGCGGGMLLRRGSVQLTAQFLQQPFKLELCPECGSSINPYTAKKWFVYCRLIYFNIFISDLVEASNPEVGKYQDK